MDLVSAVFTQYRALELLSITLFWVTILSILTVRSTLPRNGQYSHNIVSFFEILNFLRVHNVFVQIVISRTAKQDSLPAEQAH